MTFSWGPVWWGRHRTCCVTFDDGWHLFAIKVFKCGEEQPWKKQLISAFFVWNQRLSHFRSSYVLYKTCMLYKRLYIYIYLGSRFYMLSELYSVLQENAACPIPRCLGGVLRGTACVEETRGNSAAYGVVFSWIHKIHVWYNVINQLPG